MTNTTTHKSDLARAKEYLKITGHQETPDKIKEALGLSCSGATLARKFRDASTGDNPELLRDYYINNKGRHITIFAWNPIYKEGVL